MRSERTGTPSSLDASDLTRHESDAAFQRELKRRANEYFHKTGLRARDVPQMYAKTVVMLSWFGVSYWLLVFQATTWWQAIPLSISLGLAAAGIGFNIQHDGAHRAYSRFDAVNRAASMMLDAIGGSSYLWKIKHNGIHHSFPNVIGVDTDIDLGWLAKIPPDGTLTGLRRFQCVYLWAFYGLLALKWQLFDDFVDLLRRRIGRQQIELPKGWDLVTFAGGKILAFSIIFAIPATRHSWLVVLGLYGISVFVLGMTLSIAFQLAHCLEETTFADSCNEADPIRPGWAVRQIRSTADFARESRVLTWYLGGLNFQIEHHLFPRVCHVHYPALSRIVEHVCGKFGVRYFAHRRLSSALVSHYRLLRGQRRCRAA